MMLAFKRAKARPVLLTARDRRVFSLSLLCALCVSAVSTSVYAQGCAMCYSAAAAAGKAAARSLDIGILVLLLPTLLLFIGVLIFTIRRANAEA